VADVLTAYLIEASSRRFRYGVEDCALFALRWAALARGVATPAVPSYRGRRQALRLAARLGGPQGLALRYFAALGLPLAEGARRGDVALVAHGGARVFAISTGGRWAVRAGDGVAIVDDATPLMIGAVGHG
jgi:hypothetical protein